MTLAISGTGSAGMEAAVVNLIEPGDSMVVCVNGVFGGRMVDVAERAGAKVTQIERPWGEVFSPEDLEPVLAKAQAQGGRHRDGRNVDRRLAADRRDRKLVHDAGALLLVDAVTALGGVPVEVDALEIDAIYSGTQKCLSCPPGLAPVSFSPRAMDVVLARKTKVQSWYLDVTMLAKYWGEERVYHHTAPINMTYALYEALRLVLEEGLEACFARHMLNHRALKAGLAAIGIEYTAQPKGINCRCSTRCAFPTGVDDAAVRRGLLEPVRHRDRRRAGGLQGQSLANRPDGHGSRASERVRCCSRRSNNCWPSRSIASSMEHRSRRPRPLMRRGDLAAYEPSFGSGSTSGAVRPPLRRLRES